MGTPVQAVASQFMPKMRRYQLSIKGCTFIFAGFALNHRNLRTVTSGRMRGFFQVIGRELQIVDEAFIFARLGVFIGEPQQVGGMYRHQRASSLLEIDQTSAIPVDGRDRAERSL